MLACVRCRAALEPPACAACGARYSARGGVWDLFAPAGDGETTEAVGAFYEAHPFPHYLPGDDRGSILRRGRAGGFTRALDEAIPPGARVVELGCGTGQLTAFLSIAGRRCVGVDLSRASLAVAEAFRARAGLDSARFVRGNLFEPPILPGSADVAISNGVLHHTADPREGFRQLVRLLRPGGVVIVGLYNRWGRLLLPLLRRRHRAEACSARGEAWYLDQHHHPHESRHTVDEVLGWFDEEGLDFLSASPPITFGREPAGLLTPRDRGTRLEHWLAQLSWLGRAADGGLWVTVGRVPDQSPSSSRTRPATSSPTTT